VGLNLLAIKLGRETAMKHEVIISKHWSGRTYNVDLVSWQGGEGMANGRAFDVTKSEAQKVANKTAKIYGATINWKG
jgi:hypothetical protein